MRTPSSKEWQRRVIKERFGPEAPPAKNARPRISYILKWFGQSSLALTEQAYRGNRGQHRHPHPKQPQGKMQRW
jgi:hypothetical protein